MTEQDTDFQLAWRLGWKHQEQLLKKLRQDQKIGIKIIKNGMVHGKRITYVLRNTLSYMVVVFTW